MTKYLVLFYSIVFGFSLNAQLYRQPQYPQNYFRWPTDLKPDIVANMGELRNNHWHMGLDVRTNAQVNKNVLAAADGYIAYVGIEPLSWGRWIIINHPNGYSTLYGHLNTFKPDLEQYVKEHQYKTESWVTDLEIPAGLFPVKKGDFISYSGTTGGSQGPHIHWEVIDQKNKKRLNPTLFGTPIVDNIPPVLVRIAMYNRNNSTFDQYPQMFRLTKRDGIYGLSEGLVETNFNRLNFAIQAYDLRNGTSNQDGIYSARIFLDDKEISSFYIDKIGYDETRYMNAHVDYKMKANGGAWVQHTSKLPGDKSGIYYDIGQNGVINLYDTLEHGVKILVSDADGSSSTAEFILRNNGEAAPLVRSYEWLPDQPNKLFKYDFEAYLPVDVIYDKMNSGYSRAAGSGTGSVSGKHKLGETYLPAHNNFEVRIKPDKAISFEQRNKVVIKRTGKNSTVRKAAWNGEWMTAQFRDFGTFEAFVDNTPPAINNLGSAEVVNLNKASRIVFTPTDNFGIADFRVEADGKWLRFTNDKGRNYIYYFDEKITPGIHTLTATATDIAGNKTTRSWQFSRGVTYTPPAAATEQGDPTGFEEDAENVDVPVTKPITSKAIKDVPGKIATPKKPAAKKTDVRKTDSKKSAAASKTSKTSLKEPSKKTVKTTGSDTRKKTPATKKETDKKAKEKKADTKKPAEKNKKATATKSTKKK